MEEESKFVLIKVGHKYESILSGSGNFSKFSPSLEPKRVDYDTFDYFNSLKTAQEEGLRRLNQGIASEPKVNPVVTGEDVMKGVSNGMKEDHGVTTMKTTFKNKSPGKPSRAEVRSNAGELQADGQVKSNKNIDQRIENLMGLKYKQVCDTAKSMGLHYVGKKKEAICREIVLSEAD